MCGEGNFFSHWRPLLRFRCPKSNESRGDEQTDLKRGHCLIAFQFGRRVAETGLFVREQRSEIARDSIRGERVDLYKNYGLVIGPYEELKKIFKKIGLRRSTKNKNGK